MAEAQCQLRSMQQGELALVRVEGRATLSQGPQLRAYGDNWLKRGHGTLCLDLRNCTHMDSTFVGSLLYLHRQAVALGQGQLKLLSPSADCCRLLDEMGVREVFAIEEKDEPAHGSWTMMEVDLNQGASLRGCIVQAHEELAKTPGLAAQQFMRVVECFQPEKDGKNDSKARTG